MSPKRLFLGAKNNVDGSLASAVKCLSAKKERQKNISISLWSESSSSPLHLTPSSSQPEHSNRTPVTLFEALNSSSPPLPSPAKPDTISVAMFKPLTNAWRAEEAERVFESSEEESADFERFLTRMKEEKGEEAEAEEEEEEEDGLGLSDFIVPDDQVEESACTSDEEIQVEEEEENEEIEFEEDDEENEEIEVEEEEAAEKQQSPAKRKAQPLKGIADNIFDDDEDDEEEEDRCVARMPTSTPSRRADVNAPQSTSAFLLSLSETENASRTPASKYIRNFKSTRVELTEKLFKIFNEEVFMNKLPTDLPVEWSNRLTTTAGQCRYSRSRSDPEQRHARIRLSTKVCSSAERVRDTLAHEMCHAATWMVQGAREAHGMVWRAWAKRVTVRFPQLPPVSTTHAYVIFTKYTYRCTRCGAHVNRHSRSINTERMVCSLCHGTFELVVNSRSGTRSAKQIDRSEARRLNPFAQFVRENYAATKRDAGNHADAMRQLSRMFAALKTSTDGKY